MVIIFLHVELSDPTTTTTSLTTPTLASATTLTTLTLIPPSNIELVVIVVPVSCGVLALVVILVTVICCCCFPARLKKQKSAEIKSSVPINNHQQNDSPLELQSNPAYYSSRLSSQYSTIDTYTYYTRMDDGDAGYEQVL